MTVPALHTLVEEYAETLHRLLDVAAGVVAEASAPEAGEHDPRLEAAERDAALALGRLDDAAREALGVHVEMGAMGWPGDDLGDDDLELLAGAEDDPVPVDDFYLHFEVAAPAGASPEALDRVLTVVDAGGSAIADRLADEGFVVAVFSASRGEPDEWPDDAEEPPDGAP